MDQPNALGRLEAELGDVGRRRGRRAVERWAAVCPLLGQAALSAPAEVPGWVWGLGSHEADAVLLALVRLAKGCDELAALTVLACLRPGLCSLVKSLRVGMDDVVSEAALVVLTFSPTRRRRIAAGLLLDVRHRFWERQKKAAREVPMGEGRPGDASYGSPGELEANRSPAEQLTDSVMGAWRAGYLGDDAARLIVVTRVLGDSAVAAAARRGISAKAACERRRRAEARLAAWCALPAAAQRLGARSRRGHGASSLRSTYRDVNCRVRRGEGSRSSGQDSSRSGS